VDRPRPAHLVTHRLFGRLAAAGLPAGVADLVVGRAETVGEAFGRTRGSTGSAGPRRSMAGR
jgi:acyl-CoA reductase-like NAD-dependent aldehyde dehydrogenase